MKKAIVKVVGKRPTLFHKFNIESISSLTKVKSGSVGNNPEEWKSSFFEKNNQIYVPGTYWFSVFRAGSVYTKVGRGTIQKSFTSCALVSDNITLFNRFVPENWRELSFEEFGTDSSQPVYIDVRAVNNPNTKGKNIRYRLACSGGWETSIHVEWDDNIISPSQMQKVIQDSGTMIGMSDGRTLGYGRFEVKEFTILKDE